MNLPQIAQINTGFLRKSAGSAGDYYIASYLKVIRKVNELLNTFKRLCVDVGISGIVFDKLPSWRNVVAHQHGEDVVGFGGILD